MIAFHRYATKNYATLTLNGIDEHRNWLTTEELRTQRCIHFLLSVDRTKSKNNQTL